MDIQRDTVNTQRAISDSVIEKTKEKFAISVSTDKDNSNKLGIQVKNMGTNPVEIGDIWIVNNSGTYDAKKHLIDYRDSVIPPGYGADILAKTPLTMTTGDHTIKVISTLGTVEKSELTVGGSNNLRAELLAIPPDVKINQNVTLTMHVTNIGNTRLLNVAPGNNVPSVNPSFDPPDPPTPFPVNLDPAESVFFTWKYTAAGASLTSGQKVNFEGNATATEEGTGFSVVSNQAYEEITLRDPDTSETIVLTEDLLSRPGMFMVIPGPFGDASAKGLFGMNVVNPTDQTMKVNKIVISALVPRSSSSDKFFGLACTPENVAPGTGTWECPINNQLAWHKAPDPAISIPPFSVAQFLTKVFPDDLPGSSIDLESVIIHGNVYTTVGQFGKAGYGSSFDVDNAIVNVFLSSDYELFDNNNIFSTVLNIQSGTPITLNATIANYFPDTDYEVTEAEFIINVPKGWGAPAITRSDGFSSVNVIPNADTSHQIIGTLDILDPISGMPGDEARTIEFQTTAPVVTNTQMYVMYMLADGQTKNGFRIGPLTEAVLQVTP